MNQLEYHATSRHHIEKGARTMASIKWRVFGVSRRILVGSVAAIVAAAWMGVGATPANARPPIPSQYQLCHNADYGSKKFYCSGTRYSGDNEGSKACRKDRDKKNTAPKTDGGGWYCRALYL
ncbi:MAG: hypothetical protein ACRCSN_03455 [Dermatophilaceae bacterium]